MSTAKKLLLELLAVLPDGAKAAALFAEPAAFALMGPVHWAFGVQSQKRRKLLSPSPHAS